MNPQTTRNICNALRKSVTNVCATYDARPERHKHVQQQIQRLASDFDFRAVAEYPIRYAGGNEQAQRAGRIDVVWLPRFQQSLPAVAIEVDSSLRKKSIIKLLTVQADLRIWAYYGTQDPHMLLDSLDPQHVIRLVRPMLPDTGATAKPGGSGERPQMNSVAQEIRRWARTLPYWEQAALDKVMLGTDICEKDIGQFFQYLLEDEGLAQRTVERPPLQFEMNETKDDPKPDTRLVAISDVTGVNALVGGQRLEFSPQLTAIYGANGSGKSGYVRIIGSAGFTRGDSAVLPNVTQKSRGNQPLSATVTIADGDRTDSLRYEIGTGCPYLSDYYVFDFTAVRVHISGSNAISFSPAGLSALPRLAEVTDDVRRLLADEVRKRSRPHDFDTLFVGESQIKAFVTSLGANTSIDELRRLSTLSHDEMKQLKSLDQEIAELKLLNVSEQISRIKQTAKDLDSLVKLLDESALSLGAEQMESLASALDEYNQWQVILQDASVDQFKVDGLDQVGSDEWYRFIQAAQTLATEENSVDEAYPQPESLCLLCHQPLSPYAKHLLQQLWQFLTGEAQSRLEQALRVVDRRRQDIQNVDLTFFTTQSVWYRTVAELDDTLLHSIEQFLAACLEVRNQAVTAEERLEIPMSHPLPMSGAAGIRALIDIQDAQIGELEAQDPSEGIHELEHRLRELQHRALLSELYDQILQFVRDQQWAARAKDAAGSTGHITRKHNKMFDVLVTQQYISLFNHTLKALGRPLCVQVKTRGKKGEVVKKIVIQADRSYNAKIAAPDKVLSEGEKRVVALVDFLTEVALDIDSKGVVLDDPVTSLDLEWRQVIAKMLAEQAISKQVIVFTHDLPFLYFLKQQADRKEIPVRTHWIKRGDHDDKPGYVVLDNSPALE